MIVFEFRSVLFDHHFQSLCVFIWTIVIYHFFRENLLYCIRVFWHLVHDVVFCCFQNAVGCLVKVILTYALRLGNTIFQAFLKAIPLLFQFYGFWNNLINSRYLSHYATFMLLQTYQHLPIFIFRKVVLIYFDVVKNLKGNFLYFQGQNQMVPCFHFDFYFVIQLNMTSASI